MDKSASRNRTEEKLDNQKNDTTIPWGIYTPPSTGDNSHVARMHEGSEDVAVALPNEPHGGYVRIVDAKGKFFPCGFSRSIGFVMETVAAGKKRSRSQVMSDETATASNGNARDGVSDDPPPTPTPTASDAEVRKQKRTLAEERFHPEEALFLHMRGLLRIESNTRGESTKGELAQPACTMSTQDLFCRMLPDCKIPLAAYLAYAHLRAQGFILIRYTDQRMQLLCRMRNGTHSTKVGDDSDLNATVPEGKDNGEELGVDTKRMINNDDCEDLPKNEKMKNVNVSVSIPSGNPRIKTRSLRLRLSDDVATAPPPRVVPLESDGITGKPKICLAYYAHNPNARFGRSNPGLPDFGVAVMPYHSTNGNGPTFDILNSLVSMCEEGEGPELKKDAAKSEVPLRLVTVADGGAVVAFGVTNGEVPSINQANN